MRVSYNKIDKELRSLVKDLNASGWATFSCCQGKRTRKDFTDKKHCKHSFISFDDNIPYKYKRRAMRVGLVVWNGGITISPEYEDESRRCYIQHNQSFPDKVRWVFLEKKRRYSF